VPPDTARSEIVAGRYRLGAVLGRGGMSEVRHGWDLKLERDVAVKLLHPGLAQHPDARRRFEFEARTAAVINHPNVVRVLDVAEHDGQPLIVLEYVVGRSLADELVKGAMPADRVRHLARDILAGLSEAHRLRVVHRDVKPSNILLDALGRAKLADFGIAKVAENVDLTETGEMLGTLRYMAPERLTGGKATEATDIYGVGIVLHEALTGRPPYGQRPPASLSYAIVETALPALADVRADVDRRLADAIDRALRKDPAQRFASAADMTAALGATPSAPPPHIDPTTPMTSVGLRTIVDRAGPSTRTTKATAPAPLRPAPTPSGVRRSVALAATGAFFVLFLFAIGAFVVVRAPSTTTPTTPTVPADSPVPTAPVPTQPAPTTTPTASVERTPASSSTTSPTTVEPAERQGQPDRSENRGRGRGRDDD
jgi:serine/threonine protein kinase